MHEASETQSKPAYFRGQCWGALGLLTGTLSACFCCPLQLQIHQGFTHLGLTEAPGSQPHIKSTERMVAMAVDFAASLSNGVENFPVKSVEKFPVIVQGYCFSAAFFRCLNR
jgi:hypothetical protein